MAAPLQESWFTEMWKSLEMWRFSTRVLGAVDAVTVPSKVISRRALEDKRLYLDRAGRDTRLVRPAIGHLSHSSLISMLEWLTHDRRLMVAATPRDVWAVRFPVLLSQPSHLGVVVRLAFVGVEGSLLSYLETTPGTAVLLAGKLRHRRLH